MGRDSGEKIEYPRLADHDPMGQQHAVSGPEQDTPYQKALTTLGAGLRQQREARSIDLPELATRLFFPIEQLEALEAGDRSRLPEPVYVIAQARRVGLALGLGDDGRIQGLEAVISSSRHPQLLHPLTHQPEPPGRHKTGAKRLFSHTTERSHPLNRRMIGVAIACGAAAVLGFTLNDRARHQTTPTPNRQEAAGQALVAASPTPRASAENVQTTAAGQISLSSAEPSWLEVRDLAGQSLFRGTLNGSRQFPLGSGVKVIAGRPDLVQVQVGQAPARPLGRIDQVSWLRFGPTR
ncbi:MAG: hypothetical protein DCF23_08350 [Cyanobium sp.]|nr:MAG: hypothetical protein DCF23_08350 [Cyanobium sp.]